jgi:hypothetical protein
VTGRRLIDPAVLADLAEQGHYAAEIARKLGVSREAVRQAAKRYGIELEGKDPRCCYLHLSFTKTEWRAACQAAERAGVPVNAYVRRRALGEWPNV